MESAAVLGSFQYSTGTISHVWTSPERPGLTTWPMSSKSLAQRLPAGKLTYSFQREARVVALSSKTTEITTSSKADTSSKSALGIRALGSATFPDGFEDLISEVCDETSVAELKLKVGDFELHLKRSIGLTNAPVSNHSTSVVPASQTDSVDQSAISSLASSPKTPQQKDNPFVNLSLAKSSKLAALEASRSSGYKLVSSPTVGSFRKGRTVKGKRQPPMCKQGDIIKEGQVIGFVDQFGTELPVKSDVEGEVLTVFFDEGEAVGYGDPLVAVLPSFHGIQ